MKNPNEYKVESLNEYMGYYFVSKALLYKAQTDYQDLEIHEIPEFGRALRLDGIFQTSEADEFLYHELLVHVPGITTDTPQKALVIGGGDGGSIEELLKYETIEKIVMVELDHMVVEKSREYLFGISRNAFDSPKVELLIQDGIQYIENTKEKFDQIILDLTDAFGPSLNLYTKEFYEKVKDALTPEGILSLHIESPITKKIAYQRIYWTLRSVFKFVRPMLNYVPLYGTLWGFATASDYYDPIQMSEKVIDQKLKKYKINDLKFYTPKTHFSVLSLPPYVQKMHEQPLEPITHENKTLIEEQPERLSLRLG